MLDWSTKSLQSQLDALAETTQIIFVHPLYHHQNRVVHFLIEQPHTAYIRFEGDNLTTKELHSHVSGYLDTLNLNIIKMIIIDECDRASQQEFNAFLSNFADQHIGKRIVVISRMIAHELLEDEVFSQRCQFMPVDRDLMLFDYAQRDRSHVLIEVRAFGGGRVHVNGRPINNWDGILPRRLFFYFADRMMVTRTDIFQTFWSELSIREATNVFHVTKRKITDILGQSFTKFGSGYYRIAPEIDLHYDVTRFSELVQRSVVTMDDSVVPMLENAIALYRSPFLNADSEDDSNWLRNRREELHEMYGEALSMLADQKVKSDDNDQALGYYLGALKILNLHEDIVEKVMDIYHQRGQLEDALQIYRWIADNLRSSYGIEPNLALQQRYNTIKQESQTSPS